MQPSFQVPNILSFFFFFNLKKYIPDKAGHFERNLKEGVLLLGVVFGYFHLVTVTVHPYTSSYLDRVSAHILGLVNSPQKAVVEQYPPNFALSLKFWDRNLCSVFIPYELNPCVVEMLELNSVLVTVCLLSLLFCYFPLFTNKSRNMNRLEQHHFIHYNLFITVCSHIILFPLKQLFILYPAGAINENNKVHLCWLMQKPQQLSNGHSRKERSVCLVSWKRNGISLQVSGFGLSVLVDQTWST